MYARCERRQWIFKQPLIGLYFYHQLSKVATGNVFCFTHLKNFTYALTTTRTTGSHLKVYEIAGMKIAVNPPQNRYYLPSIGSCLHFFYVFWGNYKTALSFNTPFFRVVLILATLEFIACCH